ncbi:MAG: glycosyltransferase family 2 protein [Actinobacteria bacterium]|nr:MAG: glycosyltransferase family 2 protein [Actinomycetota bacterium]
MTIELSVILAADRLETIREVLRRLSEQTARERLELVVVAPSAFELELPDGTFAAMRVVESDGEAIDVARLRADGVRAASAPAVLLAETHSFPAPDSLERLIERHREPWAAVGQAICNGNPQTMRSWTNLFLDYGPWTDPHPGGAVRELPTHNSSFKRAELLACGERLPELLRYSEAINAVLRGRGGRLYLEPRARTFHVNVSRATSWVVERSAAGRAYAASRAAAWPAWRRAAYALGSPLIPLVRARRVLRDIRRTGRSAELLPRILPGLAVGLTLSALGELAGYALGAGRAPRLIGEMELRRMPHVRRGEL